MVTSSISRARALPLLGFPCASKRMAEASHLLSLANLSLAMRDVFLEGVSVEVVLSESNAVRGMSRRSSPIGAS
jgi:hypothetical protein